MKTLTIPQPVYLTHHGREERGTLQGKIVALDTVTYIVRVGNRTIRCSEKDLSHPFGLDYDAWVNRNVIRPTLADLEALPTNETFGAN
jgi:hypothetical protein